MTSKVANFLKHAALALIICCAPATAASTAPADGIPGQSPVGTWLFQNNRFAIDIAPCGDRLCGKISWLRSPCDAAGSPRVDAENADPALRSRPILGLTVLSGLRRTDDHTWDDGAIYNPEDGGHYDATLSVNGDGTLRIRAFEGISLIGKTLSLTRISERVASNL